MLKILSRLSMILLVIVWLACALGSSAIAGIGHRDTVHFPSDLGSKQPVELIAMLESEHPLYRALAAQELGRRKHADALPQLKILLSDTVNRVRVESAAALLELGDKTGLPMLQGVLGSDAPADALCKLRVAEILAKNGDDSGLALAKSKLREGSFVDRILALAALDASKDDDIAYAALQAGIADSSDSVRGAAINMLSQRPTKRSVSILSSQLSHPEPHTRIMVVIGLAKTRLKDALPSFIDALGDSDLDVRMGAATNLNLMTGLKRPVMAGRDPERAKEIEKEWREWWEANKDKPLPSEKKK